MKQLNRWIIFTLLIASLILSSCGKEPADAVAEDSPVTVEHLEGAEPTRISLTQDAALRLDIQTAAIFDAQDNGTQRIVVPYAAILYDTNGGTWVYTNPEPLVFVRSPITVDHIEGDQAFLSSGPPSGGSVVTIGVAELYGSESEFEEE
jgi:hypothetical protein